MEWITELFGSGPVADLEASRGRPLDILDLGCGGGLGAIRLAARGHRVTGVDYSETAIRLADRNASSAASAAHFLRRDCLDLEGIETGAFDLAVDHHVLHCLVDPADRRALLAEAHRVLRPEGLFFSATFSTAGAFEPALLGVDPGTRIDRDRTRYWTHPAQLASELTDARFRIVSIAERPQEPGLGNLLITISKPLA